MQLCRKFTWQERSAAASGKTRWPATRQPAITTASPLAAWQCAAARGTATPGHSGLTGKATRALSALTHGSNASTVVAKAQNGLKHTFDEGWNAIPTTETLGLAGDYAIMAKAHARLKSTRQSVASVRADTPCQGAMSRREANRLGLRLVFGSPDEFHRLGLDTARLSAS